MQSWMDKEERRKKLLNFITNIKKSILTWIFVFKHERNEETQNGDLKNEQPKLC